MPADRRLGVLAFGDSITNAGGELQWGVALQSWALWIARALGLAYTGFATDGARFDLAAWRGKTVVLYFQEGVGCEPCWTQIKDIQSNFSQLQALGVDQVVTITGDPMDALKQKAALEGITSPVLSDPGLRVSSTYSANQYGMMGTSADGHTFIVVGPDGTIRWRADYGGAPKYTMFLPTTSLLADIKAGEHPS